MTHRAASRASRRHATIFNVTALKVTALRVTVLAAALAATAARAVTLEFTGAPAAPVPDLVTRGFNLGNWVPVVDFLEPLRALRPAVVRFPGGNVGDENDLVDGAFNPLRANVALLGNPGVIVTTRVFATRADARNRPEDAAQAARSALARGLNVAYYEIGNEPDLYATNRASPEWTPERYCEAFRAQRAAILAVDPSARFAGPAASQGRDQPGNAANPGGFLRAFLRACGDVVDLLTWHEYPSDGRLEESAALATVNVVSDDLANMKALVRDATANPLGYRRDIKLGVTEYAITWRQGASQLTAQVGALWAAEAALRLAEGGASVAAYFAIQGVQSFGALDDAGFPRPTHYAFRQLASFTGDVVPVRSNDPAVWVHAARDGDRLTALVTNTAASTACFDPSVNGWTPIGAKTFTADTVRREADLEPLPVAGGVPLPARSLTRVAFRRAAPANDARANPPAALDCRAR